MQAHVGLKSLGQCKDSIIFDPIFTQVHSLETYLIKKEGTYSQFIFM